MGTPENSTPKVLSLVEFEAAMVKEGWNIQTRFELFEIGKGPALVDPSGKANPAQYARRMSWWVHSTKGHRVLIENVDGSFDLLKPLAQVIQILTQTPNWM